VGLGVCGLGSSDHDSVHLDSSSVSTNLTISSSIRSPLIVLGFCVVYGVLFMALLIFNYEEFQHHPNYTRSR